MNYRDELDAALSACVDDIDGLFWSTRSRFDSVGDDALGKLALYHEKVEKEMSERLSAKVGYPSTIFSQVIPSAGLSAVESHMLLTLLAMCDPLSHKVYATQAAISQAAGLANRADCSARLRALQSKGLLELLPVANWKERGGPQFIYHLSFLGE